MRLMIVSILGLLAGVAVFGVFATRPASEESVAPPAATATDNGKAADDPRRAKPAEVLVGFEPGTSDEARGRAARSVSAERRDVVFGGRGSYERVELLKLPRGSSNSQAVGRLKQDPAVAYAEPNWIQRPAATSNDTYFTNGSLWGMYGDASAPANRYGSQAAEAWAADHTGSEQVYVGVIDEGIDISHPDLAANAWANPHDAPADGQDNDGNGYVDDAHGWDFAGNNSSVYDGDAAGEIDKHGTHVAGTLGGQGGNGLGVAGVNWDVNYISGKFLGSQGGTTANAIKAVDYMTDLKTRHRLNLVATNNSWGGGGYSQGLLDAINRGGDAGILFVAAAGNNRQNNDKRPSYPASYKCVTAARSSDCVISVAGLRKDGARYDFTNYGATSVDLGAPGQGVFSTLPNNRYGSLSGTSMATPHVTGAAVLYAASRPTASASDIRKAVLDSARATPTTSLSGKTVTGGRLNAGGF